jgi:hypothetical protein
VKRYRHCFISGLGLALGHGALGGAISTRTTWAQWLAAEGVR